MLFRGPLSILYVAGVLTGAVAPVISFSALGQATSASPGLGAEKAYLHLNQEAYTAGETLWFTAYVLPAGSPSQVMYVDVVAPDGQLLAHRILDVHAGSAPGDVPLPTSLAPGRYLIRAYTAQMRNVPASLFTRTFLVQSAERKAPAAGPVSAVRFFPEGGALVNGLSSVVAFTATDAAGRGQAVNGVVQDDQGKEVAKLVGAAAGVGRFEFVPVPGHQYEARIRRAPEQPVSVYALPAAQPAGITMHVQDASGDYVVTVRRRSLQPQAPPEPIILAAQGQGRVVASQQGQLQDVMVFRVTKKQLPAGLIRLVVLDAQQTPRSERLVLNGATAGKLSVGVTPAKNPYAPAERPTLKLQVLNAAGQPVAGRFSVAVSKAEPAAAATPDIYSYLTLTSEIGGPVAASDVFKAANNVSGQVLDDWLLTQSWRGGGEPVNTSFAPERGLTLGGKVTNDRQEPVAGVPVVITRPTTQKTEQVLTDAQGHFAFTGFSAQDTVPVRVEALPIKGLKRPRILLDADAASVAPLTEAEAQLPLGAASDVSGTGTTDAGTGSAGGRRGIELRNVVVEANGRPALKPDPRRIYTRADAVIQVQNIVGISAYRDVIQVLQGRVPGVTVISNQGFLQVIMRGNSSSSMEQFRLAPATATRGARVPAPSASESPVDNMGRKSPLLLLDGVSTDINMINSVPVNEIETIEVLKPATAAIFGDRAGGGAIAFLTKRGNPNYDPTRKAPVLPPLYAPPRYARLRAFQPSAASDALYWNPVVQTNEAGTATLTLDKVTAVGSYIITVQGISVTGEVGSGTAELQVVGPK
ncbi:carboxypeptidase-like regulatory domain-containing protein [Hymenobacter rigui]|uniref:TonB-dependent receptor plug domain-containing protein n=1 Tax=Hymenobacter rigui TaxID=334424 RepID=A0A428KW12_9BACT|nr:carboxypeptidase regulatory-like domain-containing protein [Hymenobacter rigui]RSK51021.1 hypothetical protein EI291_01505 [Hymenobacter rigui]